MQKTPIISLLLILVIILGIGSYVSKRPSVSSPATSEIRIGAVISLTGPAASFGEFTKNGMELAAKEINDKGGFNGRKVHIIYEDDHTDPKSAVTSFKKLVSIDHVSGVIGGLWDFIGEPLKPLALENKIAYISPSNFRIEGGFELNEQSFVMLTDFNKVLKKISDYFQRDDVKKIAVVHFKSTFGEEVAKTMGEVAHDLGKGSIINESYTELGQNDFKTTIAKLKQQQVDTVFLDMVDVDTVNFLVRSRELDFHPKFVTYVGAYDAFKPENMSLLEGIIVLDWEITSPSFIERYQQAYGSLPAKSANRAYDAVYIMSEAIAASGNKNEVASYIASHPFETPNGTISFLSGHEVGNTDVEIKMFKNGTLDLYQK